MTRQIEQGRDKYQSSRREFVNEMAKHASKPENISKLLEINILALLRPLLLDIVPSIQQNAALCLGRLANYSQEISKEVVANNILPEIVLGLSSGERYYQKNCCFVIRTIAKHNEELAKATTDAGCLGPLVKCLESEDEKVCEEAAHALGFIASHSATLAQLVVDANAIGNLIISAQSAHISLRQLAISALGDIAQHTPELAAAVVQGNCIAVIAPMLKVTDSKLKQYVCTTLAHIAKHSVESADLVIKGGIFPHSLHCMNDKDPMVRRSAATLIREISKHTQEQAQMIINEGGAAALVNYLQPEFENDPLNAVMAIGFISSFSQALASSLINEKAPAVLVNVFVNSKKEHIKAATAWTLGQMGKHSPEHASYLTKLSVLELLLDAHLSATSEDLKIKSKRALKLIIEKTNEIEALQPLVERAPENILSHVLEQISKLLPKNPKAKVSFVTSGGFQAVQRIEAEPGSKLREHIDAINACYPDQALRYYSPQYPESLVKEIESMDS